jgi:hypothetical protein
MSFIKSNEATAEMEALTHRANPDEIIIGSDNDEDEINTVEGCCCCCSSDVLWSNNVSEFRRAIIVNNSSTPSDSLPELDEPILEPLSLDRLKIVFLDGMDEVLLGTAVKFKKI